MKQVQYKGAGSLRRSCGRYFAPMLALAGFAALTPDIASAASSCASTGKFLEKLCQVDATDEAGVTIAVQPGIWYTLTIYMGSWQAHGWGGPLLYTGWVTNNNGTWYRMATGMDGNDVALHWGNTFVEAAGNGYYRMTWRATTSSIRFRVADAPGKFADNSGALYLWLGPPQ